MFISKCETYIKLSPPKAKSFCRRGIKSVRGRDDGWMTTREQCLLDAVG